MDEKKIMRSIAKAMGYWDMSSIQSYTLLSKVTDNIWAVAAKLENEYNISIPDAKLKACRTIGDLKFLVNSQLNSNSSSQSYYNSASEDNTYNQEQELLTSIAQALGYNDSSSIQSYTLLSKATDNIWVVASILENQYGVSLPDAKLKKCRTVGDLRSLLKSQLNSNSSSRSYYDEDDSDDEEEEDEEDFDDVNDSEENDDNFDNEKESPTYSGTSQTNSNSNNSQSSSSSSKWTSSEKEFKSIVDTLLKNGHQLTDKKWSILYKASDRLKLDETTSFNIIKSCTLQ